MLHKQILVAVTLLGGGFLLLATGARAQNAYLPSPSSPSVSVVDATSHRVKATIQVGHGPLGVAITPDGAAVLITNQTDGTVSIINGSTNTVTATVPVGRQPNAVVVRSDGTKAYVVNGGDSSVSVVDLAHDVVSATIPLISRVGNVPAGGSANAALSADGSRLYVINDSDESVSVIDATTNSFVTAIDIRISGEFGLPQGGIAVTPDGKTVYASNGSGFSVIDTATSVVKTTVRQGSPNAIAFSPDGDLAYLNINAILIFRVADSTFQNVLIPTLPNNAGGFTIASIALAPDGKKIYFTSYQNGFVGEMDAKSGVLDASIPVAAGAVAVGAFVGPASTSPLAAAVLPDGRSVTEGTNATVFATLLNSGSTALSNCSVALPLGGVNGVSFHYQTTNPSTNALVGQLDTPVTLAPNGSQTFLLSFESASAVVGITQSVAFGCDGVGSAPIYAGVNTVDLLYSATPVSDIIALAATTSGDGVVTVPLSGGVPGSFAVASDNNGAAGLIIASVDTGAAALPVTATICQSDPVTAQCLAPPAASISVGFPANATPTFSIFVTATGAVPFAPATSRLFVRFNDSGGTSHGVTSVAVRTSN
ncbi:MAG TPA: YncE family protein [Aliidongia sp.]|uniref:YncE family protein n=1 Tax=Aliidongia sp. TaxID=1914230 RepID=UPI002DDCE426|nr:YncE family protein [Aliidongia sp.]HEV2676681.1 YncE family protein [Aliidongia sp.]